MTVINTNVKALFSQNSLSVNGRNLTNAMQQLSTGSRINSAKDDAAGLAIGTRMSADLRGMSVAMRNANDGISMMQTAEGALGEISNMLQRMRDLAAQAATGSVTSANRQAMQAEVDQLIEEIDNVASTTNFNRITLLDGSAKGVSIQTGVQAGNQVALSIDAADATSLGLSGYQVQGEITSGRVGSYSGIGDGDVQINGYDAFASGSAPTANTAAGLATAINSNSGEHRVTAEAFNTLAGTAPTADFFADGDLIINSDTVGAASSVEELVTNINRDVAGVTAVLAADGTIELSNDTGANIVIAGNDEEAAGFTAATYTGFVTLTHMDGDGISILAQNKANGYTANTGTLSDLANLGLNETSDGKAYAGAKVSTAAITIADDLSINDVRIGASSDASATAKAAAINAVSDETGVTATAKTEVIVTLDFIGGTLTALDGGTTQDFQINGMSIDLSAETSLATVVDEINSAGLSDVVASSDDEGRLILTSSTGASITVTDTGASVVTAVASIAGETSTAAITTGVVISGRITLSSDDGAEIRVEGDDVGLIGFALQGGSSTLVGGELSISTQANASAAITQIDAALDEISMSRATLGAFQNRLTAAVDNLASGSTNLAEARGRIMDTDYAKATTELARTQIVQQAATAMLAQANQQPQMVLSLLQ